MKYPKHLLLSLLLPLLSGCEAVELINSVGTILKTADQASASASPSPSASGAVVLLQPSTAATGTSQPVAQPSAALASNSLDVVRSLDPAPVSTDWNLARQPNVQLSVSSTLNETFAKQRLLDGKLTTSWFGADSDVPAQGKLPTIEVSFPQPIGILSVNLRGDRERQKGLAIQELGLLITSAQGILLNETVKLPEGAGDINLVLKKPVDQASALRITITRSNGAAGLSELEVLGRK